MLNNLNKLNFVIGIFFLIISLVLLLGYLADRSNPPKLNLYTGISFLVFGACMAFIKKKK